MQQVKAKRSTQMSRMETSKGPQDTNNDPIMVNRKNSVLPALFRLSSEPLPAPLPEPMTVNLHGTPQKQPRTELSPICPLQKLSQSHSAYIEFWIAANNYNPSKLSLELSTALKRRLELNNSPPNSTTPKPSRVVLDVRTPTLRAAHIEH